MPHLGQNVRHQQEIHAPTRQLYFLGFLTWLVPFIVSLPFFLVEGELVIDIFLFKTIMLVVLGGFGTLMLVRFMRPIQQNFVQAGLTAGLVWFAINTVLDLIVLVGLLGTPLPEWVVQTGLRYLVIPITGYALGQAVANRHRE